MADNGDGAKLSGLRRADEDAAAHAALTRDESLARACLDTCYKKLECRETSKKLDLV